MKKIACMFTLLVTTLFALGGLNAAGQDSVATPRNPAVSGTNPAKEAISVRALGAGCNGSRDDTKAFDQAQDSLLANPKLGVSHGGTVLVPPSSLATGCLLPRGLRIEREVILSGSNGAGRFPSSVIVVPPGAPGIVVDAAETSRDGGQGSFSVIQDIAVVTPWAAGDLTSGSDQITNFKGKGAGLAIPVVPHINDLVISAFLPSGTYVTALNGTTLTLSNQATHTIKGTRLKWVPATNMVTGNVKAGDRAITGLSAEPFVSGDMIVGDSASGIQAALPWLTRPIM